MSTSESGGNPGFWIRLVTGDSAREELGRIFIPYALSLFPTTPSGAVITPDPKVPPRPGTTESGAVITPDSKITIPPLGQQGRPIRDLRPLRREPFKYDPEIRPRGEFIAGLRKEPGKCFREDFGLIRPLAESPRKIVFEVPANLIGPIELNVKDRSNRHGHTPKRKPPLSAAKTNLLKGKKTTFSATQCTFYKEYPRAVPAHAYVRGRHHHGRRSVSAVYDSTVAEVNASGKYTTTRQVTGIIAGGCGERQRLW